MTWESRTVTHLTDGTWLEERKTGIGASEIAAVLGLSHFDDATPLRVCRNKWGEKDGVTEEKQGIFDQAHRMEPFLIGEYNARHGDTIFALHAEREVTRHPVYDRLFATRDALVYPRRSPEGSPIPALFGLDVKWLNTFMRKSFGDPGSDDMPFDYVAQGAMSCEIFDVPKWVYGIMWSDKKWEEYEVPRMAPEDAELLCVTLLEFWDEYIEQKKLPPMDASRSTGAWLKDRFPSSSERMLLATQDALKWARQAKSARDIIRREEKRKDEADHGLQAIVGENSGVDGVCSWKTGPRGKLNPWSYAEAIEEYAKSLADAGAVAYHLAEIKAAHIKKSRTFRLTYKGD